MYKKRQMYKNYSVTANTENLLTQTNNELDKLLPTSCFNTENIGVIHMSDV